MSLLKGGVKSWILFTLILIGLLGALFVYQQYQEVPGAKKATQEEVKKTRKPFAQEGLNEEERKVQDQKNLDEALLKGSAEGCEAISDEAKKTLCLNELKLGLAFRGKNPEACDALSDPPLKNRCKDELSLHLALKALDSSLCEKIQDSLLRQNCLDQLQRLLGGSSHDLASCLSLQNASLKVQCVNQVHYTVSLEKNDRAGCLKISDPTFANRCEAGVAQNERVLALAAAQGPRTLQTASEKSERCQSPECKDQAQAELALEKRDLKYCEAIEDPQKQKECLTVNGSHLNRFYLQQAIGKRDSSLCQKIFNDTLKLSCLQYLNQ